MLFLSRLLHLHIRVVRDFFGRNHGLLLSGAVAYNIMLSLIPLSALVIVLLSNFFEEDALMQVLTTEVALLAPRFVPTVADVVRGFLEQRGVIGWIGGASLLFFSSLAFRVLEDAMAIIFHQPLHATKRPFWISALLPYLFIGIITVGVVVVTSFNSILDSGTSLNHLPWLASLVRQNLGLLAYLGGFAGLVALFTLFYRIMPVVGVSFRMALLGGVTAAILWELVRHLLVRYYATMSMVNFLYGSMATIVIVLLTLEAASVILLFGAQVIAEFHRNAALGLPWYADPEEPRENAAPAMRPD
ncbi:MAG: YihY/virulence factor BrkB family protein [Verrucomicrobiota bacterium]